MVLLRAAILGNRQVWAKPVNYYYLLVGRLENAKNAEDIVLSVSPSQSRTEDDPERSS